MSAAYETVEVPFISFGNRRALSDAQIHNSPWLKDFIDAFAGSFERDEVRYLWWLIEPENAPTLKQLAGE